MERVNFCKFKIDTSRNKYSSTEISKEVIFFKDLAQLLTNKKIDKKFKRLIEKSIKPSFVFMQIDYKTDSANLNLSKYIFQSQNSYGNIFFLSKDRNIIASALSLESRKEMLCISQIDTLNYTVTEFDYDYYKTNVFPTLGKFSTSNYHCGTFFTDNYYQLDKLTNTAKRENVKRFD